MKSSILDTSCNVSSFVKWEYKVVVTSNWNWSENQAAEKATAALNTEGKDGWELVAVYERFFYFKRLQET